MCMNMSIDTYNIIIKIAEYIPWIPTLIFVLLMLRHFLSGIRRGRSKSLKLFICFILSILATYIFFIIIRKNFDSLAVNLCNLFKFDLGEKFNTKSSHDTLTGYFEEMLSNNPDVVSAIEQNNLTIADAAKFIYSLALVCLNFVLYFTCIIVYLLFSFIFYIFYLIFAREGRRRKRINEKAEMENSSTKPYKIHRLGGGLIGLLRGFIASLFILAPMGIISFLITDGEAYNFTPEKDASTETKAVVEIINVVSKYNSVGIGKVLSVAKNKDGIPLYLIAADKLTSSTYTYTDENGETVKLQISLSKDIGSLTRPITKTAYIFLKYGFDTTKSGDSDYLAEFLSSDKEIDGKTLEQAVNESLSDLTIEESSMLGYLCNILAITSAQNAVGSNVDESNISEQELSKKLLYHAFIGKNSLKCTDIVSGNLAAAFSLYMDIYKYKDELDALGKAFGSNTSDSKLVFGISKTVNLEETTRGKEFADIIYADILELSFYNTERFNYLLTDIIKDILSTYIPKFDFSTTTNQNIYDIKWPETISTVFTSLGALIDNVINNNIESGDDLMQFYLNELSDSGSSTYKRVDDLLDSSAISIILNTNGFNTYITDKINNSLSDLISEDMVLPNVYWGNYKTSDGKVETGELKKFIDCAIPTFVDIYNVTKNSNELTDAQSIELIKIISNPEGDIYNLIDTSNENHSILMHSIISSLINDLSIEYENIDVEIYYEDSVKETLISHGEEINVINTSSIKEILNFLYVNASLVPSIQDGSVDIIDFLKANTEAVKNSTILLDLTSQLLTVFTGDYLEIPERLSLDLNVIEDNITLWTDKENGEMVKFLNIINDELDLIKFATDESTNFNDLVVTITKLSNDRINKLFDSVVINATFTKNVVSATEGTDFVIEIPEYAYKDTYKDTLKNDEFESLIKFIKHIFSIDNNTTSVNFDSINFGKIVDDEAIKLIKQSSIALTTCAYWINDNLASGESDSDYLDIPTIYKENVESNSIKSHFEESPWREEIPHLFSDIKLLGIEFEQDSADISIDASVVLNAKDDVDTLLLSDIIWYTLSDYLLDVDKLVITENDALTNTYNETYINKDEFKNLLYALDVFAGKNADGSRDFTNIDVNLDTAVNNIELIKNSSIIRSYITEEISKDNVLVMNRIKVSDSSEKDIYVNTYKTYINKSLSSNTLTKQLTANEIEYFLLAAKAIIGNGNSYDINYNNINISNIKEEYLESTIVLNGLQDLLRSAGASSDESYIYNLSDSTQNTKFITEEKAKEFIHSFGY